MASIMSQKNIGFRACLEAPNRLLTLLKHSYFEQKFAQGKKIFISQNTRSHYPAAIEVGNLYRLHDVSMHIEMHDHTQASKAGSTNRPRSSSQKTITSQSNNLSRLFSSQQK